MTRPALLVLLATACASRQTEPTRVATTAEPAQPVTVTFVAGEKLVPGEPYQVGARFDIPEGWHVYWINPGDTGLPTRLVVEAAPHIPVEPVRFPGPMRFTSPGNIESFGYEREVILWTRVMTPEDLEDPLEVSLAASWLACRDICVPGKASIQIVVPVAGADPGTLPFAAPPPPAPWSTLAATGGHVRWWPTPAAIAIEIETPHAAELFPGPDLPPSTRIDVSAKAFRVHLPPAWHPPQIPFMVGVLHLPGHDPEYVEVTVDEEPPL